MTGTSSRTARAQPRGSVWRKLQANSRPEVHEAHTRRPPGGRGDDRPRSPMSSGPTDVDATGIGEESHAPNPLRSARLPALSIGIASDPPPNGPLNPKARGPCGRDPSTEIFSTTQLGLIMRAGPPWWRPGRRIGSGPPSLAPTRAVEGATTFQVQSNPRAICSTAGVEIGNFVVVSNASRRGLFAAALGHIHQARSGRVRDRSVLLP